MTFLRDNKEGRFGNSPWWKRGRARATPGRATRFPVDPVGVSNLGVWVMVVGTMLNAISAFGRCLVVIATAGSLAACYQTTGEFSPLSTASIDTQNSARAAAQASR